MLFRHSIFRIPRFTDTLSEGPMIAYLTEFLHFSHFLILLCYFLLCYYYYVIMLLICYYYVIIMLLISYYYYVIDYYVIMTCYMEKICKVRYHLSTSSLYSLVSCSSSSDFVLLLMYDDDDDDG